MNGKKLVLHIGMSKTGTTTVQFTLNKQRKQLKSQGVLYPRSMIGRGANHDKLASYALDDSKMQTFRVFNGVRTEEDVEPFREAMRKALRDELAASDEPTVIMSNEHCAARLITVEEIRRLKALLDEFFDETRVVIYIREQVSLLVSSYSTSIKEGHKRLFPSVEKFRRSVHRYDYARMLGMWEDVFGRPNLTVRLFDRSRMKDGDVLADFCETVGITIEQESEEVRNRSLNLKQLEFMRRWNTHLPKVVDNTHSVYRKGLNNAVVACEIESPKIDSLLTREYLGWYDDSNERVRQRYFPEIEAPLFKGREIEEFAPAQTESLAEADTFEILTQLYKTKVDESLDKAEKLAAAKKKAKRVPRLLKKIKALDSQVLKIPGLKKKVTKFKKKAAAVPRLSQKIENLEQRVEEIPVLRWEIKELRDEVSRVPKLKRKLIAIYRRRSRTLSTRFRNVFLYLKHRLMPLSGFDVEYYLAKYLTDTKRAGAAFALRHFIFEGVYRGYKPNEHFKTRKYVIEHPSLAATGENALVHYNRSKK